MRQVVSYIPRSPTAVLLEQAMVEETRYRLEEKYDKQDDADDWVMIAEITLFIGDVDA